MKYLLFALTLASLPVIAQTKPEKPTQPNLSADSASAAFAASLSASLAASKASTGDVSVNTRHRRAPVNTAYAGTGMNTADMLVCFSLAGQTRGAGASGIKCWLQRDLYANYRAALHAEAGRFEASAKAACSKPLFAGDFDNVEHCRASVYQSLIDQSMEQLTSADYEKLLEEQQAQYEEKIARIEKEYTVKK